MSIKTNAMRVLDQRQVEYQVHEYSPEIHSAVEAAQAMGKPPECVYKTLVVMREAPRAKPLLVMVPATASWICACLPNLPATRSCGWPHKKRPSR